MESELIALVKKYVTALAAGDEAALAETVPSYAFAQILVRDDKNIVAQQGGLKNCTLTSVTSNGKMAFFEVTFENGRVVKIDAIKDEGKWGISALGFVPSPDKW